VRTRTKNTPRMHQNKPFQVKIPIVFWEGPSPIPTTHLSHPYQAFRIRTCVPQNSSSIYATDHSVCQQHCLTTRQCTDSLTSFAAATCSRNRSASCCITHPLPCGYFAISLGFLPTTFVINVEQLVQCVSVCTDSK